MFLYHLELIIQGDRLLICGRPIVTPTIYIKDYLRKLAVFYLVSFVYGGISLSLLYFISPSSIQIKNGVYIGYYPYKIVFLSGIIGTIILSKAAKVLNTKFKKEDMFCNVEIELSGKTTKVSTMIDTGNLLKDPLTKASVIIVESKELIKILPQDVAEVTCTNKKMEFEEITKILDKTDYKTKFRLLPFSCLGNSSSMLVGFRADNVKIKYENRVIENKNAVIGIYNQKLDSNAKYSALIGTELITKGGNSK